MADTTEYEATFQVVDRDHDGKISAAEIKELMVALGEPYDDARAQVAMQAIDADGDGAISLPEFADFLARHNA